jgi:hypothetical protein
MEYFPDRKKAMLHISPFTGYEFEKESVGDGHVVFSPVPDNTKYALNINKMRSNLHC